MSPKEVEEKLNAERVKGEAEIQKEKASFYSSKYEDELPANFLQLFEDAVFMLSPRADNISMAQIEIWHDLPREQWNFGQVGKMAEVISLVPRVDLFANLKEATEGLKPIEVVVETMRLKMEVFTKHIEDMQYKLKEKLHKMQYSLVNMKGVVAPQKSKEDKNKQPAPAMSVAQ